MKVLDPGHAYGLDRFPGVKGGGLALPFQTLLQFMKREGEGYPGNVGHVDGTNCQEVIRALIDRIKYLDNQIPHPTNEVAIDRLRDALWLLEQRAAWRHGRELECSNGVKPEDKPTCPICGHWEPEKHNHGTQESK